jgi:hypothetical protein
MNPDHCTEHCVEDHCAMCHKLGEIRENLTLLRASD